jgi:hypothetical protein
MRRRASADWFAAQWADWALTHDGPTAGLGASRPEWGHADDYPDPAGGG